MSFPAPPAAPAPHSPHGDHCASHSSGAASLAIGIIVHVCGSIGINTGQNIQAIALSHLDEAGKQKPWKSKAWVIGCTIFVTCSILNFVALTLAPASILVPMESVQFVTNVLFGKFVRKVEIPLQMWLGVLLMILGTALAVVFGAAEGYCFSLTKLKSYWGFQQGWAWWIYIAVTFSLSAVCLVAHNRFERATKAGRPLRRQKQLQPVAFAIPSALLGGAQMIVHSKTLAELAELIFSEGQVELLGEWFFWVSLLLVSGFGIFWFYRLTVCLGMYDPLFIIPLMQACFILFGGVAGGIFFHEFADVAKPGRLLGWGNWFLYILGFAMVLYGLYLVAPKEAMADDAPAAAAAAKTEGEAIKPPKPEPSTLVDPKVVDDTVEATPVTAVSSVSDADGPAKALAVEEVDDKRKEYESNYTAGS